MKRIIDEAQQSKEKLAQLLEIRSEIESEWGFSLSSEERILLDALPDSALEKLVTSGNIQNVEAHSILPALLAKAAVSDDFRDDLIRYKGDIGKHCDFEVPSHVSNILNSLPDQQIRLMISVVKRSHARWLSTYAKLGLAGLAILVVAISYSGTQIKNVFGNRPDQTTDDYFQQGRVLSQKVEVDLSGRTRREILSILETEARVRIYVSAECQANLSEVVAVKEREIGKILMEVLGREERCVFYALNKIIVE